MATHPYPAELVTAWRLADGSSVGLRPIRPEDAQMEQEFVKNLSAGSRYFRFMNTVRELTPVMLARFTQIDYEREMAFVAVREEGGRETEIAVARYVTNPDGETCEFAIVVADSWQRKGLGRRMLERLIEVARARGLKAMVGHVLAENRPMLALCGKLGFETSNHPEDGALRRVTLALDEQRTHRKPGNAVKRSSEVLPMASDEGSEEASKKIDMEKVAQLIDALERDLAKVRSGSRDVQLLRDEVETLKNVLNSPIRRHHWVREGLHGMRKAFEGGLETAVADGLKAGQYIAEIGRILGM